jgi:hypothetical protein
MKYLQHLLYYKNILYYFDKHSFFLLTLKVKNKKINFLSKKLILKQNILSLLNSNISLKFPLYFLPFKNKIDIKTYIESTKKQKSIIYIKYNYFIFYKNLLYFFLIQPLFIFSILKKLCNIFKIFLKLKKR